jgi:hypothetical protein
MSAIRGGRIAKAYHRTEHAILFPLQVITGVTAWSEGSESENRKTLPPLSPAARFISASQPRIGVLDNQPFRHGFYPRSGGYRTEVELSQVR